MKEQIISRASSAVRAKTICGKLQITRLTQFPHDAFDMRVDAIDTGEIRVGFR